MSETTSSQMPPRREFLMRASAAATLPLAARVSRAFVPRPPFRPMRRPRRTAITAQPLEATPAIEVIALNRMAFGPRPGDLEAFRALGPTPQARLESYVEQQLHPESIDDSQLDARLAAQGFTTLNKSLEQLWSDHMLHQGDDYHVHILPAWETVAATWQRAVYSQRQLLETLTDFWHNHFNVDAWQWEISPIFVHYDRDVIRAHALGNFREMLQAVATSTAMLYYLDNFINSRAGPNENYGRELLELHTLGAENYLGVREQASIPGFSDGQPIGYVDEDVYEATRCFTGWRVNDNDWQDGVQNTGTFLYYDEWHDRFQKTFLGHHIPSDQAPMKDGEDVLDLLAAHPGTGRFIARKLARRFIADDPPQEVVDQAAAIFTARKDAPDQLRQTLRVILLSDAFRETWGQKVKRPFEFTASALRAINAEVSLSNDFFWFYRQMGQPLFSHTTPDGYPDVREDWLTTYGVLQRWRMAGAVVNGWIDDVSADLLGQTPAHVRTPNALADFWIQRILGRSMASEHRQTVVDFIAQGRNPAFDLSGEQIAERLPSMVQLILMSPEFQLR